MSESVTAVPRNRSIEARRAMRRHRYEREKLIVEYLNRGLSVPEIAASCGVTEKHMRACVREALARRMPSPPAEFLAIQVSRLNEALLVAYSAMSMTNLRAVDRVVKIVRELDRYHGFAGSVRRLPDPPRAQDAAALESTSTDRRQLAPQALEKMESAPEDQSALEAVDPTDMAARLRAALSSRLAALPQDPPAIEAPQTGRREKRQTMDSVPDNDTLEDAAAAASLRSELASRLAVWRDRLAAGSSPVAGSEMAP